MLGSVEMGKRLSSARGSQSEKQKSYVIEVSTINRRESEEMYPFFSFKFRLEKIFLAKFRYRDRTTIVGHILSSINRDPKGKTKTSIMRSANLNFDQVNKYLDMLTLCDFVKARHPMNGEDLVRYRLTGTGLSFLKNFEAWRLVLESYRRRII